MGSYIEASLMPGEQVVYNGRMSTWVMLPQAILAAMFILSAFICLFTGWFLPALYLALSAGVILLHAYLRYSTTEYALTNRRIVAKLGIIGRSTIDIDLRKAESIRIEQGIWGRIFNFGSIFVSGAGVPRAQLRSIDNPMQFHNAFLAVQEQASRIKKPA